MADVTVSLETAVEELHKLQDAQKPYKVALSDQQSKKDDKFLFVDSKDIQSFGVSELDEEDDYVPVFEGRKPGEEVGENKMMFIQLANGQIVLLPEPLSVRQTTEDDIVFINITCSYLLNLLDE